jgi:hypothetical protein
MTERLKVHVLKTCLVQANVGSNPTPSAENCMIKCPNIEGLFSTSYAPGNLKPSNRIRGGARVAEWARLLSECWVKPVAGSNPVLPATTKTCSCRKPEHVFVFNLRGVKSLPTFALIPTTGPQGATHTCLICLANHGRCQGSR